MVGAFSLQATFIELSLFVFVMIIPNDQMAYHYGTSIWLMYIGLTLIPAWICDHILYKVSDEITDPFLNLNGATVEV